MWLLLTALVSARRPLRQAIAFATTSLASAFSAFYAGKALIYDAPRPGGSSSVDGATVVLWVVLELLAGPMPGALFQRTGTPDRFGAMSLARPSVSWSPLPTCSKICSDRSPGHPSVAQRVERL
jgi:hypothetical protein